MKKFFLSLTVMLTMGASVFANALPETNPRAKEIFQREFSSAEFVKWSVEDGYSKVSFVLGGTRAIALFSKEGELLGSMRDLVYNQLPLSVIKSLEQRFAGAAIFDMRELVNADGTRYKFTVEEKGKKYSVSIFPDGMVGDIVKIKK